MQGDVLKTLRTRKLTGMISRENSSSNHPFSGDMLVSGRVPGDACAIKTHQRNVVQVFVKLSEPSIYPKHLLRLHAHDLGFVSISQ